LAVIAQDFERGAGAVPEDLEGAAEGIIAEGTAADGGEPIDAFAEVDRLCGHKDTALWSELKHHVVSRNVRTSAVMGHGNSCA
jgi:hypothetical protein